MTTIVSTAHAAKIFAIFAILCSATVYAQPLSRQVDFNIASQRLAAAIVQFSEQAHVQVISSGIDVTDQTSAGLVGRYTVADALSMLLKGTGLRFKAMNESTVSLQAIKVRPAPTTGQSPTLPPPPALALSGATGSQSHELDDASSPANSSSTARPDSAKLGEIVVTAQKRTERLQDVPESVTAISADSLVNGNLLRLQDYYTTVPGLNLVSNGSGSTTLSIRGITTGGEASPTVGIVVDDAPFGVSTALTYRVAAPDIDPSELARVEVLRGPQGTLYGASSIGGLIKFVTVDPSTEALSGRVEASTDSVYNGAELGYAFRGAVNVPITDDLAVRASAFKRRDPGYIDGVYLGSPALKIDGINETDVDGGRLSALWHPSADWSLKVSALFQDTTANGTSNVTLPPVGDLEQELYVRGVHGYTDAIRSYIATLKGNVGGINLVSISGYNSDNFHQILDLSSNPFVSAESSSLYGVTGAQVVESRLTQKFTEELRASSSLTQYVDWLLGLFYTHERTPTHDVYQAVDTTSVAVAGLLYDDPYPTTYTEYAVFSDLTFHVTDKFDIQVGGRESENRQTYTETLSGPAIEDFYGLPSPLVNPPVHTKDNAFTYLVTPSYKFSPDLMTYVRIASGYRPGGPNPTCSLFAIPCHFQPDKTVNYELGVKSEWLEHRISVDASAYYIDWKDIQLQVYSANGAASYFTNASTAKSQGLELSVQARPVSDLKLSGWVAWNDARLTADMPPNGALAGNSGDPLPYSSRFSGNFSLEEDFSLTDHLTAFSAGSVSYVGDRKSDFTALESLPRLDLPSYALTNLRAGLHFDTWTTQLFFNNVANKRGVISGGTIPLANVVYIQPRTIGLTVSKAF